MVKPFQVGGLILAVSMLLSGCSSLNPFASDVKNKPAQLVDFQSTAKLSIDWKASVGSGTGYVFTPLVANNGVYAATADGTLARFDRRGVSLWRINSGASLSSGVGGNGRLAVVGTAKGEVLAFDAESGRASWKAQVSSEVLATPVASDGLVLVRSGDSRIYAFDAQDGKRRWVYQRSTPALSLRSHAGMTLSGDVAFIGFPGGKLVALSTVNGAVLWEGSVAIPKGATELERVTDVASAPVVFGEQVCAAAYQGRVACFELKNGNPIWAREISSISGIDIDQKAVYVSDDKGSVHAFNRGNGSSMWRLDKLANRGLSRPMALSGYVAIADQLGALHLLRGDDGVFAARLLSDDGAIVADIQRLDNGLLMQTRKGNLFSVSIK
jgi:outer membrane protein assembly factor BamB